LLTNDSGQDKLLHKKQAKELEDAWDLFYQKIPSDQRVSLDKRVPPFDDVKQAMASVASKWETDRKKGKTGKICSFYTRCCLSIKSHETMLKILPEGDKYFSLFSGVLKSVVFVRPATVDLPIQS
jgi:hypothetical protein